MTDKEKILAKIESLLYEANYEPYTDETLGKIQSLKELKSYIDTIPEEPISDDLEAAAMKYDRVIKVINEHSKIVDTSGREYFILGSQWKEQQMMKNALPCVIEYNDKKYPNFISRNVSIEDYITDLDLRVGDKVKMIILKDE